MILPIGNNCCVASALRISNQRICSYPLDWVLIDIKNLESFLELLLTTNTNDVPKICQELFNMDNGHTYIQEYNNSTVFVNNKYNISFPHDDISTINDKYIRRITRLIDNFYKDEYINIIFGSRWDRHDIYLIDIIKMIIKLRSDNIHFYIINGFENPVPEDISSYVSLFYIDYKEEYVKNDDWSYDKIYEQELSNIFKNIIFKP